MSFLKAIRWLSEGKWITGGFALVLMVLGTVSFISYQNAVQLAESSRRVRQTNSLIQSINDLSATLTNAESGRRGYILFGDAEELTRYQTAVSTLRNQIKQLREALKDIPEQQYRIDRLEILINQRLLLFQQSIELFSKKAIVLPSQDPLTDKIRQNRAEVRQLISSLIAHEEKLLEVQLEQSQKNFRFRMFIELSGTLLTFLILLGVYILLYQQLAKRQQAEALQRSLAQEKELGELKLQFFSMVSHEFRTPLSLIVGSAQLLEEKTRAFIGAQNLKNLHRIQSSANSIVQALSDLLTLARAEVGKQEFNPTLIEMQTFCLNLVEDLQVFSDAKREIRFFHQGVQTHGWADEKLLYSILSNLLLNAIKYSAQDTSIDFTLICNSEFTIFEVKDEGIGIPDAAQINLYDPFMRADNVGKVQGTGLGLAVVRKCVELHQGEIQCHSQMGIGTTFTVRIPQEPRS